MKNRSTIWLLAAAFAFAAFTLGFFCGRVSSPAPIEISHLSAPTRPVASTAPSGEAAATVVPETLPASPQAANNRININTATAAQLETLPGIGPVLAQRIISYREANGPFTSVAQLTFVNGIGQKRLTEIMDLITVEQEE